MDIADMPPAHRFKTNISVFRTYGNVCGESEDDEDTVNWYNDNDTQHD